MNWRHLLSLIPVSLLTIQQALASPCCSGSAVAPSLIAGDQARQFSLSFSRGSVIGDAFEGGPAVFRETGDSDLTETLNVEGATLVTDRWQIGASLPVVRRTREAGAIRASSIGIGDPKLTLGFEALPEYTYSRWLPRGFTFLQLQLPTARSKYDSSQLAEVDARGIGVFRVGIGALFVKQWSLLDAYALPEIHYSAPRTFQSAQVGAAWGGGLAWGLGWSPFAGNWRVGIRANPSYESRYAITTAETGAGSTQRKLTWNTAFETSYLMNDGWSGSLTYLDQTLVGPAFNSTLSRAVTLSIQRKWDR